LEIILKIDKFLFFLIHFELKNNFFDLVMPIIRNKSTWIPLYFFILFFAYKSFKNKNALILFILSSILIVAISDLVCAQILKNIFERIRPCHLFVNSIQLNPLVHCSDTFSFPSCHAFNHGTLAFFWIYNFFKSKWKWLLLFWALLIGFAQIYVGVHFPMDVIGGIIFSYFYVKIASILYQKLKIYFAL
jgi:undecaprenyl-diphosphatase